MGFPAAMIAGRVKHQRGVALLTALLIVAVIASISTYLAWDITLEIRRTQNLIDQDRAYVLCRGAENWVALILQQDARKNPGVTYLDQNWATPLPPTHIGDAVVSASVTDMQGRLNLNAIDPGTALGTVALERVGRLLALHNADPRLSGALADWVDPSGVQAAGFGAETGYYMTLVPPYRAANRPFVSPSSLRLVRGFDARLTAALDPEVAALPLGTTLNVNTASRNVLESLGLSATTATAVIEQRLSQPFQHITQFVEFVTVRKQQVNTAGLGVYSHFFLVRTQASLGATQTALYSLVDVGSQGKGVDIVLQSINQSP